MIFEKMLTEYHFPTMIYVKDIPNAVQLNQYLEPKIIQWSQQDKGQQKTNAGGWHSTTNMNKKEDPTVHLSGLNNIIEIQAFPESNDVVGLKDLYLSFDVSNSTINTIKDVIASGEDVSGVVFTRDYYTSSYSNGDLERK